MIENQHYSIFTPAYGLKELGVPLIKKDDGSDDENDEDESMKKTEKLAKKIQKKSKKSARNNSLSASAALINRPRKKVRGGSRKPHKYNLRVNIRKFKSND